jgi:hypothetical protein
MSGQMAVARLATQRFKELNSPFDPDIPADWTKPASDRFSWIREGKAITHMLLS